MDYCGQQPCTVLIVCWHINLFPSLICFVGRVFVGGWCTRGSCFGRRSRDQRRLPPERPLAWWGKLIKLMKSSNLTYARRYLKVDPAHPLYTGPIWLLAYPAPLDTLPYFTRVSPLEWLDVTISWQSDDEFSLSTRRRKLQYTAQYEACCSILHSGQQIIEKSLQWLWPE